MDIKTIHHYTSVETLSLILSSGKLRFNRIDRVDDIREAQKHSGIDFGKYFFVSCWTYDPHESIPQWHMYTQKMTGVRISLPATPFQQKVLRPKPEWKMKSQGTLLSPLTFEEQFGHSYFVVPMFMEPNNFGGPVEYVEDIEHRYAEAVKVVKQPDGKVSISISKPFDLVRLKSKEWSFQAEYRFFLFVLPSIQLPPEGPGSPQFYQRFPSYVSQAMLSGVPPAIDYIDVDLSKEVLDSILVTTGPLCSRGTKICVQAIVERYASKGRIEESCFTGTIRSPIR
jgi:hypothetical protein